MLTIATHRAHYWLERSIQLWRTKLAWCSFGKQNRKRRYTIPTKKAQRLKSKRSGRPPTPRPRQTIVTEVLALFESIYGGHQELSGLKARIEEVLGNLEAAETNRDLLEVELSRAREDPRISSDGVHLIVECQSEREVQASGLLSQLEELQSQQKESEKLRDAPWVALRPYLEQYFNECLGSNFRADWSLSEESCIWLRHCVELQDTIAQSEKRKREWWIDLARVRNRLSKLPPQVEQDGLRREDGQILSNISAEEKALDRRRQRYSTDRDRFCEEAIRPLLEATGRIEPEPSESADVSLERGLGGETSMHDEENARGRTYSEDHAEGGGIAMENQSSPREGLPGGAGRYGSRPPRHSPPRRSSTSRSPPRCSPPSRSPLRIYQIRAGYLKQLDTVDRLREEYDAEINRLSTREYQHLLTFTESSHQRYEQFIEEQMECREEELGRAEEELAGWFRHFRADEVPRSPDPSPRSVRGGGISKGFSRSGSARSRSSTPPERRYALKRGRINRYRLKADEVPQGLDLPLEPPSPDKSIARLSCVRSRSHTYSRSPDPEFDQYLDKHREQYNKEQEENVGKYGLPAVEGVPEV